MRYPEVISIQKIDWLREKNYIYLKQEIPLIAKNINIMIIELIFFCERNTGKSNLSNKIC